MGQDFGLSRYAELFVASGAMVLVFDYRNFGRSEGQPRNVVSPARHVEDWLAAVDYVTNSSEGGLGEKVRGRGT